jgi:hypothetical protein
MNTEIVKELIRKEYEAQGWTVIDNHIDYDLVAEKGVARLNLSIRFSVLFKPTPHWESDLFKLTSWSMVHSNAFSAKKDPNDRVIFLLYHKINGIEEYKDDFFSFPVNVFRMLINQAPMSKQNRKLYISKHRNDWFVRKYGIGANSQNAISVFCTPVSRYRRSFS